MDVKNLISIATGQERLNLPTAKTGDATVLRNDGDSSTPSIAADTQREEFNTFLTLLTAQIRNQDPLAPLDSTQFVEQLATFSSLELQAEGNQVLENIANMLAQNLYTAGSQTSPTLNDLA